MELTVWFCATTRAARESSERAAKRMVDLAWNEERVERGGTKGVFSDGKKVHGGWEGAPLRLKYVCRRAAHRDASSINVGDRIENPSGKRTRGAMAAGRSHARCSLAPRAPRITGRCTSWALERPPSVKSHPASGNQILTLGRRGRGATNTLTHCTRTRCQG